jgi:hypothetical protein
MGQVEAAWLKRTVLPWVRSKVNGITFQGLENHEFLLYNIE